MPPMSFAEVIGSSSSVIHGTSGLWSWFLMSGLALMTSAVILAALYAWATLFRNPQLLVYIKSELYEMLVTAALIPIVLGMVGAMNTLTIGSLLPPDLLPAGVDGASTIYQVTGDYYTRVGNDLAQWLYMDYAASMYVDQASAVTVYIRPVGVGLVSSPLAGFASPIKQLLYNMATALSISFFINEAFMRVGLFFFQAFLQYYLPVGIFLRCFTPTRRLGGTLIGVAVAFFFVFPSISVLSYMIMYTPAGGPMLNAGAVITHFFNDFISGTNFRDFFSNNFLSGSFIDLVLSPFNLAGTALQNLFGALFMTLLIIPASAIAMGFAVSVVLPTINLMIFTQAARDLSKSFGEEVDVSSLLRVI